MTQRRHPQLWAPLATGVIGTAISCSVGLGQHHWEVIVIGEMVTVLVVGLLSVVGAQDSDVGAVLGHRADERQELVRLRAARVSAIVAVGGSIIACVVTAAVSAVYWPFEVIYLAAGLSYLIGIRVYGADREVPGVPTSPPEGAD